MHVNSRAFNHIEIKLIGYSKDLLVMGFKPAMPQTKHFH